MQQVCTSDSAAAALVAALFCCVLIIFCCGLIIFSCVSITTLILSSDKQMFTAVPLFLHAVSVASAALC